MAPPTHYFGDGSNAISTDSDPNTTAPPDTRIFRSPKDTEGGLVSTTAYAAPRAGSTITILLWVKDPTSGGRWFKLATSGTACPTDQLTTFAGVPLNMDVFAQVTANTNVTKVGIGFLGAGGSGG